MIVAVIVDLDADVDVIDHVDDHGGVTFLEIVMPDSTEIRPRKSRGLPPAPHTIPAPDDEHRPHTWTERNGASILAFVLGGLFLIVLLAQMTC